MAQSSVLPKESFLCIKAADLSLRVSTWSDIDKLSEKQTRELFKETLFAICSQFYDKDLEDFTIESVNAMKPDLRLIIRGLRDFKGKDRRGIARAKTYVEGARVELGVAAQLFDDEEEPDAAKRIRSRLRALVNCQNHLDKAYEQL